MRARLAGRAAEAGQNFDLVAVDFRSKTTVEGDYLEVTPKGLVPALKLDDGGVLTESAVILQWVADQHPERALLPLQGTRERYAELEWLNFVATDLHKALAVLFSPFVDKDSKIRFAEGVLIGRIDSVEDHLSRRDYALAVRLSVADAYLYNALRWPDRGTSTSTAYAAINAYMARKKRRPSVQAAPRAEGI